MLDYRPKNYTGEAMNRKIVPLVTVCDILHRHGLEEPLSTKSTTGQGQAVEPILALRDRIRTCLKQMDMEWAIDEVGAYRWGVDELATELADRLEPTEICHVHWDRQGGAGPPCGRDGSLTTNAANVTCPYCNGWLDGRDDDKGGCNVVAPVVHYQFKDSNFVACGQVAPQPDRSTDNVQEVTCVHCLRVKTRNGGRVTDPQLLSALIDAAVRLVETGQHLLEPVKAASDFLTRTFDRVI